MTKRAKRAAHPLVEQLAEWAAPIGFAKSTV
jgi:hypothetical protein